MDVMEKELSLQNPLSPHPFYMLVETSGSHDDHDKEVSSSGQHVTVSSHTAHRNWTAFWIM